METALFKPILPTLANLMARNMYPGTPTDQIMAVVEQEINNLTYVAMFKPEIENCVPETIFHALRKVVMQNLSFDPDLGLVHLTTRKSDIKNPQTGMIEKRSVLECKPSVNGELSLLKMAGSLIGHSAPKETFDEKGYLVNVHIDLLIPVYNQMGQLVQTRTEGFDFDIPFFKKLEGYSHRQNMKGKKADEVNNTTMNCANANYSNYYPEDPMTPHSYDKKGGINPGFAVTKALKHALIKAKLDKNPFAKRNFDVVHERVVNEEFDTEDIQHEDLTETQPLQAQTSPIIPTATQPTVQPQQTPTQPTPAPAMPIANTAAGRKNEVYYTRIAACTTSRQVKDIFYESPESTKTIEEDADLLKYLKVEGKRRADAEAKAKIANQNSGIELPDSSNL